MPLYFKIQMRGEERSGWFMPVIFYSIAAVLKVLPLSETSARLPSVLIGVTDIILIFFIARRMFTRRWLPLVAAGMLALTPAHFILSRYALDYLYPLPFALGWLLCLLTFLESGRPRTLFAATLLLGIGFYSYIAAVLMAPIYLLFTGALLFNGRKPARDYLFAAAGFALPLLMLVPWLAASDGICRHGQSLRSLQHGQHGRASGPAFVPQLQQPRRTRRHLLELSQSGAFCFSPATRRCHFLHGTSACS